MQLLLTALTLFCIFLSSSEAVDCGNDGSARVISVDQRGSGQFTSVQPAIDSVPSGNDKWISIQIKPGTYKEMVTIPPDKPCIFLKGESRASTIIAFDSHEQTDTSATFTSNPDNIVVQGISFKNSYNRFWVNADEPPIVQALAARIYGDKCVFLDCGFLGVQDTLWDVMGRHYFYSCYIEGAIDFIFGRGQSFFEDCTMNVTANSPPYQIRSGWVTAQNRESPDDPSGFVFEGGAILGVGPFLLGRAYGPYSRVIFHKTFLSSGVAPQGWDSWRFQGKEDNFMYAEVDCQGKGSDTSKRVRWEKQLDKTQLRYFSRSSFLDREGWLVKTPLGKKIRS
ncbi:probable pectinesterase 66 [Rhodamnia argentea]|uniref:Pectinesterase n=1 Tax=Rhodamnia argentea TaxID=178133 RepID=A0A8B8QCH9_9MYRT|nr:probable pectinesterase 66 [Rhodamnia argentea]